MATNEPDIAAKLLEHLDAKYAAGQLSPAEHEARRTRLLADIQRGPTTGRAFQPSSVTSPSESSFSPYALALREPAAAAWSLA